ncbi:DUF126 domain-containing protein [soil metagenome]
MTEREIWRAHGRVLVDGRAVGVALVLSEPLSFWGGLDIRDGTIIDERHPQCGQSVQGRALVMPGGRGSSSSSSVLAEAIRGGTGPAAILLARPDEIVALGALVVSMLDGISCPVLEMLPADYARFVSRDLVDVGADGQVVVKRAGALV